jgi:hypothetical protein
MSSIQCILPLLLAYRFTPSFDAQEVHQYDGHMQHLASHKYGSPSCYKGVVYRDCLPQGLLDGVNNGLLHAVKLGESEICLATASQRYRVNRPPFNFIADSY